MLEPLDFRQFFREIHQGREPFPWQERLAHQACAGEWPDVIDLPTASGKTACIDIALFALACRGTGERRIFFVVDRRVVVNEAFLRTKKIAEALEHALDSDPGSVKGRVARRLQEMAGGGSAKPLETVELRGGIYRDEGWIRTPLQPMVIASTVDQVGSRLLFRGYGVSESARPIHAGLIGNDSLILLDEAHCSRVFAQTLRSVSRYRGKDWATAPVQAGFRAIEMTATPATEGRAVFRIADADRAEQYLGKRMTTRKTTRLVVSKNRPRELDKLAETLMREALAVSGGDKVRRVAVIVNRIATARRVYQLLRDGGARVDLMIGRMRPYDRDRLLEKLGELKSGVERAEASAVRYVVSTQCLEVGADLDFDAMVTECASMDALQQRFGRLNRLGEFEGESRGVIVIGSGQIDGKQSDPVYGEALSATWAWLSSLQDAVSEVNMGIEAAEGATLTVAQQYAVLPEENKAAMRMQSAIGPLLLPSHLDALSQTNPQPACEPEISLFLHGRRENEPDVQVVWRADLEEDDTSNWADVVSLCPPVSAEALQVPISAFKRWLDGKGEGQAASDLEGAGEGDNEDAGVSDRKVLRWRGDDSKEISKSVEVLPGDTFVVPAATDGFEELGHRPEGSKLDIGDIVRLRAKRRLTIRLHPKVWEDAAQVQAKYESEGIEAFATPDPGLPPDLQALLREANGWKPRVREEEYPRRDESQAARAWVIQGIGINAGEDSGRDELSQSVSVALDKHLADVENVVGKYEPLMEGKLELYKWVARFHDYGKADIRFQAMLRGGDMMAARFAPKPLAKSEGMPLGPSSRKLARDRSGLPSGFRHEFLSLVFAGKSMVHATDELGLHLIATHHGQARPLAAVVFDDEAGPVSFADMTLSQEERTTLAAHRLGNGVTERFWHLTRQYGWWGLAWYETLFRLADWEASALEARGEL